MNISDRYNIKPYKGDVGIEIEVEGCDLPERVDGWKREYDGSLRGDENAEFVTNKPTKFRYTTARIKRLIKTFEDCGSVVDDTVRAGVHIHLNVQKLSHKQLVDLICTYYIVEEIMTDFCGEGRQGNLFCLRNKDAEDILFWWKKVFDKKDFGIFHHDDVRYCALNLKPVVSYGSIEFRAMRTPQDFMKIVDWVKLIKRIKDFSLESGNVKSLLLEFSMSSTEEFLKTIFGEDLKILEPYLYNENHTRMKLLRGVRYAQDILYMGDWSTLDKNVKHNKDKITLDSYVGYVFDLDI